MSISLSENAIYGHHHAHREHLELFNACRNGDVLKVKKLLNVHNVNSRDMNGRKSSPLHFASGFGRREVVELLIKFGANLNAKDDGGLGL